MIPLVAAIVLAGAAGAGPVLVSDVCGGDSTDDAQTKCAVAEVERVMRSKQRPRELKVDNRGNKICCCCVGPTVLVSELVARTRGWSAQGGTLISILFWHSQRNASCYTLGAVERGCARSLPPLNRDVMMFGRVGDRAR